MRIYAIYMPLMTLLAGIRKRIHPGSTTMHQMYFYFSRCGGVIVPVVDHRLTRRLQQGTQIVDQAGYQDAYSRQPSGSGQAVIHPSGLLEVHTAHVAARGCEA